MNRPLLFLLTLATTGLGSLLAQNHNVLVIIADDLGVDYVTCYGEGTNPPPTPTIDALAANGVKFRNAWANPSCSPTRACIQTGRFPFRTMVGRWIAATQSPQNVGLLQAAEVTLPEVLNATGSGYANAMIGKWHLHDAFSSPDTPRTIGGWSHYAGSLEGQIPDYFAWTRVVDGVPAPCTTYCTIQNTNDALAWIGAQTGPWFCVLAYQAPHIPYHVPPANLHTQNLTGLTPQPLTHTPANIPFYRAMVQSLDTEMGRLFSTLGTSVMASTNVIFLGDNGTVQQQSVAPFDGNRSKGTPYEGGVNVPLIVSGPIVQQPGREVQALACAVDVYPTALALAGIAPPPPNTIRDGVSLMPYLTSPGQAAIRQYAYTEEFTGTTWPAPNTNGHATIRDAHYKLIHRYSGGGDELFDLLVDPWENNNLVNSTNPTIVAAKNNLLAQINSLRSTATGGSFIVFGNNTCAGTVGVPSILGTGDPTLGGVFYVQLSGAAPVHFALNLFGGSYQTWQGAPLPLNLSLIGAAPNCELSSSGEIMNVFLTSFTGGATQSILVPNNVSLVGATVYSAWVVLDPTAPNNPGGYVSTNSLATTIGL